GRVPALVTRRHRSCGVPTARSGTVNIGAPPSASTSRSPPREVAAEPPKDGAARASTRPAATHAVIRVRRIIWGEPRLRVSAGLGRGPTGGNADTVCHAPPRDPP